MADHEEDFGFYIAERGNPIATALLKSVEREIAELTPDWVRGKPIEDAVSEALVARHGLHGYMVAGFAELERRVIELEGLVRDLMAR